MEMNTHISIYYNFMHMIIANNIFYCPVLLISTVYTAILKIINNKPNIVPCTLLLFGCILNTQILIPNTNQISFEKTVDTA